MKIFLLAAAALWLFVTPSTGQNPNTSGPFGEEAIEAERNLENQFLKCRANDGSEEREDERQ